MGKLSFNLPKHTIEHVMQTFSEVYDWGLRDLNVPDIHKKTLGEGIKVAVIDSGKSTHFETINNTVAAANFSKSPHLTDLNGHSSFLAGIIAAEKNNQGIIGVAPKAKLYFGKAMDDAGIGEPSALVKAINWAIQQKVDIMSISAGMFFDFKPLKKIIKKAYKRNIIICAAVGNTNKRHYDVAFPARYPEVIGVAAYDQRHKVAKFSSRGTNVSFAMPGVNIYSTYPPNTYAKLNGTCLVGNTQIMTPDGYKWISEIRPGDEVYSINLDSHKLVLNVIAKKWKYSDKSVLEIISTNNKITCTPNHPFWVQRKVIVDKCFYLSQRIRNKLLNLNQTDLAKRASVTSSCISRIANKKRSVSTVVLDRIMKEANIHYNSDDLNFHYTKKKTIKTWVRAEELTCSDRILSVYNNLSSQDFDLPISQYKWKHKVPTSATPQWCRLIGFYLGDGFKSKYQICFAMGEYKHIDQFYMDLCKDLFGKIPSISKDGSYFRISSVSLCKLLDCCGLSGTALTKRMPFWCFSLPLKNKLELILGMLESDGTFYSKKAKKQIVFTSGNINLIGDFKRLCQCSGIKTSNIITCKNNGGKIEGRIIKPAIGYYVSISETNAILLKQKWLGTFYKESTKQPEFNKICSISQEPENQDVYDICMVNQLHPHFIANNMVVHNSFACPIMAGICALILAKHREGTSSTPCKTPRQMMEHLKKYAKKLNGKNETGFGNVDLKGLFEDE